MVEIADFVPHAPVEPEVVAAYRDRVPAEIVEIWEEYGYGTFGEGFIRVINPGVYEAELGDRIGKTQGDGIAIPVMVTGLGDLITWEPSLNGLVVLMFRSNRGTGMGKAATFLGLLKLDGSDYLSEKLGWDVFPEAVQQQGAPAFDESFIFVPLPSLGGPGTVDTLQKRQTLSAIQVMVDLQGPIGH
ncbi:MULTISPECIES: GAD-like domain-containing protein [unclassified Microbacterium]|uniref:GAD-like domain-containing protein n=1 Tax=unclassified Microbacterium TaxID=2609290 RepID=UPI003C2EC688